MNPLLMIAEDDPQDLQLLQLVFKDDFQKIICCDNGGKVCELIKATNPSLVILDWGLPQVNGLEICKKLNSDSEIPKIPIVMVTGHIDIVEAVLGLELGVDDYVRKPFDFRELKARVHAVLRRYTPVLEEETNKLIRHNGLSIDEERAEAFLNGVNLELTNIEYNMLKLLLGNPAKTYSRHEILDRVWDEEYVGNPRAVDVFIRHLRGKMENIDRDGEYIKTIRGRGWRLV